MKRLLLWVISIAALGMVLVGLPRTTRADVVDRIDIENHTKTDVQFVIKKAIVDGQGCLRPGQSDRDFYVQKVIDVVITIQRAPAKHGGCGGTGMTRELWFRYKPPNETFRVKEHAGGYYVERS